MVNIILFGPPGSGKGTQAVNLVEKYNLLHISTGDLFREAIGNKTELGMKAQAFMDKGQLVPDSITIGMLEARMNANQDVKGFILDGFPRTIAQAEALDAFLASKDQSVTGLLALDVEEQELINRLLERGKSSGRSDDMNESVIKNRIQVYRDETSPVFNYYEKQNRSHKIDGIGSIEEIFDRLSNALDSLTANNK